MRRLCSMLFLVLLISILCVPMVSATTYVAGDTVTTRSPSSGMATSILAKPKFIRYTLVDPVGNVVYETNHELTYVHEEFWGLGWTFYDEYAIRVPGFPVEGTWKIQKRLFQEFAWVIDLPASIPDEVSFEVASTGIVTNLLAPHYFTFDLGMVVGRVSFVLPFSAWLLVIVAVVIVAFVVVNILTRKKPAVRYILVKKKG